MADKTVWLHKRGVGWYRHEIYEDEAEASRIARWFLDREARAKVTDTTEEDRTWRTDALTTIYVDEHGEPVYTIRP